MKHLSFVAATLAVSLALPASAQTSIPAPRGWTTQTKVAGAPTFTPSDLRAGEVYLVTIYDLAPLGGKTFEAYLRSLAGPVGSKPGQLAAALGMNFSDAQSALARGISHGPNGTRLLVVFVAFSFDGGRTTCVARVLASEEALTDRYHTSTGSLIGAMVKGARQTGQGQTGQNQAASVEPAPSFSAVPDRVSQHLKPGGALVPGVYAGNQYDGTKLRRRLRVYVYAGGEFRICNERDADFQWHRGEIIGTGEYAYNRSTGQLSLDRFFGLTSSTSMGGYCYFGRDAQNKPLIFACDGATATELRLAGAPTKRLSPKAERARKAATRAEDERYKFVATPGRGLKNAQIAAILVGSGIEGSSLEGYSLVDQTHLLLRDGTVHDQLPPYALDQFNVAASKQKEPGTWGRWRRFKGKYEVSWAGEPFDEVSASRVSPAPLGLRLNSRFEGTSASRFSHQIYSVSFSKTGRFSRDSRDASTDDGGEGPLTATTTGDANGVGTTTWEDKGATSTTSVEGGARIEGGTLASSESKKKNPKDSREGTYSFNGYTLTLRYDNGQVERIPTFRTGGRSELLWFDGTLVMDDKAFGSK